MTASKYRRACNACQKRHLKCDLASPCASCSEAGRECFEEKYQFRNNEDPHRKSGAKKRPRSFPKDQLWTSVPKNLEYVFESAIDDDGNLVFENREVSVLDEEVLPEHIELSSPSRDISHDSIEQSLGIGTPFQETPVSSSSSTIIAAEENHVRTSPTGPLWPVSSKAEAILLQYFSTELSILFDFLDKERHFSTVVVHAAATSPALHFAILAVSAKHLSLTQGYDRHTPDKYQHECLKVLIPALSDPDALLDENLFAATIILRFFDEMTERDSHEESAAHVIGSHMIVNARRRARANPPDAPSTLRFAVLNIELRQEVHIAFIMNRPTDPWAEYCNIDRSFEATDDWTWTWRMIAHTADTLTYCNGNGSKSLDSWNGLMEYLDSWAGLVPPSFRPFYEEASEPKNGKLFPQLLFANDCHAAGYQYMSISRIILLAHDPQIPLLGTDRLVALRERDTQIKDQVLKICGIAVSNKQFIPVTFAAGIAIAMCGERFTDRVEQEALMCLMGEAEQIIGWQRLRASVRLKRCWGWP